MQPQLLNYLADPHDASPLEAISFEGDGTGIREGILLNPQSKRWYPIRDGIPSLFVDALREDYSGFVARHQAQMQKAGCAEAATAPAREQSAEFARIESERKARDEQAEDYDRMWSLRIYEWIEKPAYRRALAAGAQGALLEAGCGTGRFTGLFAAVAREVVAVDMSRDSILRNRVRHAGKTASSVYYVHADLTHLPLRDGVFRSVAHCGVYEHIPSRQLREQFLQHARRVMEPNGKLLLSAYRYGGLTRLFEKEGEHPGGIPFFRFTEPELRGEVESQFRIDSFRPNLGIYMSMLTASPA